MTKIDHIGIATKSIEESEPFWEALGFSPSGGGMVIDQGVKVRYMVNDSETRIELLEPTSADTPVGRFIDSRGVGIQQLAISVDDISRTISELLSMGIRMINTEPQIGHGGNKIAFVHPASSGGVLVELVEYV
ncbi:MAG TPA: methylmalonyl-CoA epimerase [Candidatus Thalassarchaeaceae archaeon]|jgi:methylmalonyl-CoA epimerase|nr:methylmalonyl-CoA epimerase [Euryarchaeota archaeon]DAC43506.1 MAG TPA: methylmalonyl-CoA epimerase [Candidatus Poseidoniales archaeon]HII35010.1 methylmalonyl-CoA epimerase [Candidatus Thalassarchaeaceae archaeon]|tara:strand:+ start:5241 stop:5639 length:399 start_codon:yes stop_codon:yes gene_type:complete